MCFTITSSSWNVLILKVMTNDFELICSYTHENTLEEVVLETPFSIDCLHMMMLILLSGIMFLEDEGVNRVKGGVLYSSP